MGTDKLRMVRPSVLVIAREVDNLRYEKKRRCGRMKRKGYHACCKRRSTILPLATVDVFWAPKTLKKIFTCIHQIKEPALDLEHILKTRIRPIHFFENYQCLAVQRHLNAHNDDFKLVKFKLTHQHCFKYHTYASASLLECDTIDTLIHVAEFNDAANEIWEKIRRRFENNLCVFECCWCEPYFPWSSIYLHRISK